MGSLQHQTDDPAYPRITYRHGAAGIPQPVLRGTGIRVQTIVIAAKQWGLSPAQIAEEYGQPEIAVHEALAFYEAHRAEIDALIIDEESIESRPLSLDEINEIVQEARRLRRDKSDEQS